MLWLNVFCIYLYWNPAFSKNPKNIYIPKFKTKYLPREQVSKQSNELCRNVNFVEMTQFLLVNDVNLKFSHYSNYCIILLHECTVFDKVKLKIRIPLWPSLLCVCITDLQLFCPATHRVNHCSHDGSQQVWALQRHTHIHTNMHVHTLIFTHKLKCKRFMRACGHTFNTKSLWVTFKLQRPHTRTQMHSYNRLLSDTQSEKSLQTAGRGSILSVHALSWSWRKGSAVFRTFCVCLSLLWSSFGQVNWEVWSVIKIQVK